MHDFAQAGVLGRGLNGRSHRRPSRACHGAPAHSMLHRRKESDSRDFTTGMIVATPKPGKSYDSIAGGRAQMFVTTTKSQCHGSPQRVLGATDAQRGALREGERSGWVEEDEAGKR
uniref:Uncharacterized protein n=1 Tax=Physcomitrium patens TaxID=3218 RepID=A9SA59_PHYPA|nr:hypothetical protein PHYPA_006610 [Physcomitrium patens]PNR55714.1 hypothetical protein PHYPA_006611 [Physcomitrium patens]